MDYSSLLTKERFWANIFFTKDSAGDSAVLVDILQERLGTPNWNIYYLVKNIKWLAKPFISVQIYHIFCEGNSVADIFANWGIEHQFKKVCRSVEALPKKARGALRLDYIGMPCLQKQTNLE